MTHHQTDSKKKAKSTKASKARAKRTQTAKGRVRSKKGSPQSSKKTIKPPEGKVGKND